MSDELRTIVGPDVPGNAAQNEQVRERADKLAQIAKAIKSGEPLKSAVKQVGISEPTYYQWKKAAAPAPAGDELTDLLALEKENKLLKSMLVEQLRKENAELKRKLGLP